MKNIKKSLTGPQTDTSRSPHEDSANRHGDLGKSTRGFCKILAWISATRTELKIIKTIDKEVHVKTVKLAFVTICPISPIVSVVFPSSALIFMEVHKAANKKVRHPDKWCDALDSLRFPFFVIRMGFFCDPVGIRTRDPQLRRLLLYPAELQDQPCFAGAKVQKKVKSEK